MTGGFLVYTCSKSICDPILEKVVKGELPKWRLNALKRVKTKVFKHV